MDFCQSMTRVATPVYEGALITRITTNEVHPKGFATSGYVFIDEATGDSTKPVRILLSGIITVRATGTISSGTPVFVITDSTSLYYGYVTDEETPSYAGIALSDISADGICAVAFSFAANNGEANDDLSKLDDFTLPLGTVFRDGTQKSYTFNSTSPLTVGYLYNAINAVIGECTPFMGGYNIKLTYDGVVLVKYYDEPVDTYRPDVYSDMSEGLSDGVHMDPVGLRKPYKVGHVLNYDSTTQKAWVKLDIERPFDNDEYAHLEYVTDNCYIPSHSNVIEFGATLANAGDIMTIRKDVKGVIVHKINTNTVDIMHEGACLVSLLSLTDYHIGCDLYINPVNGIATGAYATAYINGTKLYRIGRAVSNYFAYAGYYYVWVKLDWQDDTETLEDSVSIKTANTTNFNAGDVLSSARNVVYNSNIPASSGIGVLPSKGYIETAGKRVLTSAVTVTDGVWTADVIESGIVCINWNGTKTTSGLPVYVDRVASYVNAGDDDLYKMVYPVQIGTTIGAVSNGKVWITLDGDEYFTRDYSLLSDHTPAHVGYCIRDACDEAVIFNCEKYFEYMAITDHMGYPFANEELVSVSNAFTQDDVHYTYAIHTGIVLLKLDTYQLAVSDFPKEGDPIYAEGYVWNLGAGNWVYTKKRAYEKYKPVRIGYMVGDCPNPETQETYKYIWVTLDWEQDVKLMDIMELSPVPEANECAFVKSPDNVFGLYTGSGSPSVGSIINEMNGAVVVSGKDTEAGGYWVLHSGIARLRCINTSPRLAIKGDILYASTVDSTTDFVFTKDTLGGYNYSPRIRRVGVALTDETIGSGGTNRYVWVKLDQDYANFDGGFFSNLPTPTECVAFEDDPALLMFGTTNSGNYGKIFWNNHTVVVKTSLNGITYYTSVIRGIVAIKSSVAISGSGNKVYCSGAGATTITTTASSYPVGYQLTSCSANGYTWVMLTFC